jgi:GNAT superfamily N-acetyltransferase
VDAERAAARTREAFFALGHDTARLAGGLLVTSPRFADVWDANLLSGPTEATPGGTDTALAALAEVHAHTDRLLVWAGPDTPASFEAELAARDWELDVELQLVLTGRLRVDPPAVTIRPARTAGDWASLLRLYRADHVEEAQRRREAPVPEETTRRILGAIRAKGPTVRTWIASVDGDDAAFFSSWPGVDGVGIVEDLFTLPAFRGRGLAAALLATAVDDCRARGARDVLICALVDDTPKHAYRRMGFRPVRVARAWLGPRRTRPPPGGGPEPDLSG